MLVSSSWKWRDISAETCRSSVTDITINYRKVHLLLLPELITYEDQCAGILHGADKDPEDESSKILRKPLNQLPIKNISHSIRLTLTNTTAKTSKHTAGNMFVNVYISTTYCGIRKQPPCLCHKHLSPLRLWDIIEHGFWSAVDFFTQLIYNRRSLHYFKKNKPADAINLGKGNVT